MSKKIADFTVGILNRTAELRADKVGHRIISAFKNGVLTGLKLGETALRAGLPHEEDLIEVLTDSTRDLDELLGTANKYLSSLPSKHSFDEDMFRKSGKYRTEEDTADTYSEGIKLGYAYVFDLVEALIDPVSEVVARRAAVDYLKMVNHAIERM